MLTIEKMFRPPCGITVPELAARVGLHPATLSRIVRGKQKPSFAPGASAERIAEALGWEGDVRELFAEAVD